MHLIMIPLKSNLNDCSTDKINNTNWITNRGFYLIYTLSIVRGFQTIVCYVKYLI